MKETKEYISLNFLEIIVGVFILILFFSVNIYFNHENWCMCKDEYGNVTTWSSGFTSEWNYTKDCDNRCGGENTSLTFDEYDSVVRGIT
jgi:hypothetical protein